MRKPISVYLFGWFGYRNLGDDLLLEVMLERLSALENVSSIEVAVAESGYLASMLMRYSKACLSDRNPRRLIAASRENDLLLVGPGGLFPHTDARKVAAFATAAAVWKLRGREVAFFLFGANARQDAVSRTLWRLIESMSVLFVPRDADLIEAAGIRESAKAFPAADAVLSLDVESFFRGCLREGAIAFCFANLFEEQGAGYREFVARCSEVVSSTIDSGCKPVLLSFTAGVDERMNADIAEMVGGCADVLSYEQTLEEVRSLGRYMVVVGMRFHACVLSMLAHVPVVPVSYSSKTERLIRDCGMEDNMSYYCNSESAYYGEIIPLDSGFVADQVCRALTSPQDYLCAEPSLDELRRRSLMAFKSLETMIRGGVVV